MKRLLLIIAVALASAMPMWAADSSDAVVNSLVTQAPGLRADVLKMALSAATTAEDKGLVPRRDLLVMSAGQAILMTGQFKVPLQVVIPDDRYPLYTTKPQELVAMQQLGKRE